MDRACHVKGARGRRRAAPRAIRAIPLEGWIYTQRSEVKSRGGRLQAAACSEGLAAPKLISPEIWPPSSITILP